MQSYSRKLFISYLLLIFASVIKASPLCNSFPKIFGGYPGDIDVFEDYLALAGDLHDSSLSGLTVAQSYRMPYIALMSISKSSKIYWAKGLP